MKDYRLVLFSRQAFLCRDIWMSAENIEDLKRQDVWVDELARELMADDADEYPDMVSARRDVLDEEYFLVCIVDMSAEFEWGNL
jgi:hypothetical protein